MGGVGIVADDGMEGSANGISFSFDSSAVNERGLTSGFEWTAGIVGEVSGAAAAAAAAGMEFCGGDGGRWC